MGTRKITIKCKKRDLPFLRDKMEVMIDDEIIEENFEVEENEDLYKFLSTDPRILDWKFNKDNNLKSFIKCPDDDKDRVKSINIMESILDINCSNLPSGSKVLCFLEAVLRIKKKSPALKFTPRFLEVVRLEYDVVSSEKCTSDYISLSYAIDESNKPLLTSTNFLGFLYERLKDIFKNTYIEPKTSVIDFIGMVYTK